MSDGEEIWKVSRKDVCERSWGTPLIHDVDGKAQIVVNGYPWIASYDLESGEELWRIKGGGDNPVPTPFEAHGWLFITNAHGGPAPIFVVRPDAQGDLTAEGDGNDEKSKSALVWDSQRGGSYMSTPVVYGDYLYLGNSNGCLLYTSPSPRDRG